MIMDDERAKMSEDEKAPRDCGGKRVIDKGQLKFICKQVRQVGKESITKVCQGKTTI